MDRFHRMMNSFGQFAIRNLVFKYHSVFFDSPPLRWINCCFGIIFLSLAIACFSPKRKVTIPFFSIHNKTSLYTHIASIQGIWNLIFLQKKNRTYYASCYLLDIRNFVVCATPSGIFLEFFSQFLATMCTFSTIGFIWHIIFQKKPWWNLCSSGCNRLQIVTFQNIICYYQTGQRKWILGWARISKHHMLLPNRLHHKGGQGSGGISKHHMLLPN